MSTPRVRFEPRPFALSHLHQPRGLGTWVFSIASVDGNPFPGEGSQYWSPPMHYAQAKAWAARMARASLPEVANITLSVGP